GKEIVVNGNIVVPPYGTTARRYMGVLGTRRLELGDGYGIHGTDHPETIAQSVSHGCVRMRNADIERLYPMVAIGTPVYIYLFRSALGVGGRRRAKGTPNGRRARARRRSSSPQAPRCPHGLVRRP